MRHDTLKAIAIPYLLAIQSRMTETFGLAVLDERRLKNRVIFSIRGPDYSCFSFKDGTETPLHTSAPGKALVAYLPDKRRGALLDRLSFERLTPNTITDRAAFEKRLALIRREGYATDLAEELTCCHCGGVALLDPNGNPVGALWLSGIDKRLREKTLIANIRHLQWAARHIERDLAKRPDPPRTVKARSPCVTAALAALRKEIGQSVDYAALARASRVSYSTLRTLFRKETGTSLGRHHLTLRLEEVQRLLTHSSLSVTAIAERTGFCDQKHLSALFKRKVGASPLAYRKRSASDGAPRILQSPNT